MMTYSANILLYVIMAIISVAWDVMLQVSGASTLIRSEKYMLVHFVRNLQGMFSQTISTDVWNPFKIEVAINSECAATSKKHLNHLTYQAIFNVKAIP